MRDGSDDELMRRAGRGDQTAYSRLVERHLPRAVALATRIAGSRGDEEEIVQEAFLRTWLKAPDWRDERQPGGARFTTWFTRVVVNLCIDRRRKPIMSPLDLAADLPSTEISGFDTVAQGETRNRLLAALAALPERQRAALTLCHWDGMTNIEASEVLGISVGALESLLVRARRTLRDSLADLAPDKIVPLPKTRTMP
ncbi:MAG: RNA polymerase sigma factor [Alphaproteobacteria bacterium]|nr:RNA polymerase sigma factor [Alphaproteobacteria bacterium]